MIKTSELMVGNVVWSTEFNRPHFIQWGDCGDYEEIPLTREIMDKIGEKKLGAPAGDCCWYKIHRFRHLLSFYDERWEVVEVVMGCEIGFCYVNTIHQLQNILTANGLPEAAKEVGEKVMEFLEREGRK